MIQSDPDIVERLQRIGKTSAVNNTLDAQVLSFDPDTHEVVMSFTATPAMCHSRVIVQGGFITAMVDCAMAYSAMGAFEKPIAVPTLEIKVSFLKVGNAGQLIAKARPQRLGKSVGFIEAELFQNDDIIATSTSTIRIIHLKDKLQ